MAALAEITARTIAAAARASGARLLLHLNLIHRKGADSGAHDHSMQSRFDNSCLEDNDAIVRTERTEGYSVEINRHLSAAGAGDGHRYISRRGVVGQKRIGRPVEVLPSAGGAI